MAGHRLSRLVAVGPTLNHTLVGMSIDQQCCAAERAFFQQSCPGPERLAQMRADLNSMTPIAGILERLDIAERFACLDSILTVKSIGESRDKTDDSHRDELTELAGQSIDWNLLLSQLNSDWDRRIAACRETNYAKREAMFGDLDNEFEERAAAARSWNGWARAFFDTRNARSERLGTVFLAMFVPAMSATLNSQQRAETDLAMTKLVFSIAAYRADHGAYPAKLSDLVPRYAGKVPDDAFAAAPIQYRITDYGYILHSTGPYGFDDVAPDDDSSDNELSDGLTVRVRTPLPEHVQP
jgi:hypothetical protein